MDIFYPFYLFADMVTYDLLRLVYGTGVAEGVHFFVYDTLKIFTLLTVVAFIMGLINVWLPVSTVREYLTKKRLFGFDYFLAALFGTVTPFCACSSVPLFIGFVKGGIPLGVTFAFLISSPLVDSVVIAMLIGMFGLKITVVYVASGIVAAMLGGYLLGRMNLERHLTPWVRDLRSPSHVNGNADALVRTGFSTAHLKRAWGEALAILKSIWLYVCIGIGIGAFIHGFVPVSFFETYMSMHPILAIPLSVIVAVPLYANAAGVLPIAHVLVGKGLALGVVLSFMMAAVALSIPSGILLRKVMTLRLLAYFYGVTTLLIILLGYLYYALL